MALDNYKVARPYAKALFEMALEHSLLSEWFQAFLLLQEIMENESSHQLLNHPKLSRSEQVEFFAAFVFPEKIEDTLKNFLFLLAGNKRLGALSEIAGVFIDLYKAHQRRLEINVLSYSKMTDLQLEKLGKSLEKRFNKKIDIHNEVDESVLGGIVVKAGNIVIDLSVSSQLDKMINQLVA